jgi:hypothetical protein
VKALFSTFCANTDTTGVVSLVLEVFLRHYCSSLGGVAEALLLVARGLARPHAASIPDAGGSTSRCLRISCRRGCLRRTTKRRR